MIYEKQNPTPMTGNRYQQCFEYMFVLSKGKPNTFNPIMTKKKYMENRKVKHYNKDKNGDQQSRQYTASSDMKVIHNIWRYTVGLNNSTKDKVAFQHPAVYPEKLAEDHILSWSNEGDIVFDPFMGSGTTAKMAQINKRKYLGFEISSEYIEITNKRLESINQDFGLVKCTCGTEMFWCSDEQEDDVIVSLYYCQSCGSENEVEVD
jgi:site-specific DNA-methyltransferase (adenine-specific)